jgi:hypothetical protein
MVAVSVPAEVTILRLADRAPVADGVNVTLIVQLVFPAAKLAPQLLVCPKSAGFAPENPMLVISNEPLPEGAVLVSVTVCGALDIFKLWLKVRVGARVPVVDAAMPVPVTVVVTAAASPAPLTDTVAVRVPVAVGLNTTLIVQVVPGPAAKVVPQVPPAVPPGRENSPAVVVPVGVKVTVMAASCTVPVLVNVSACGALVVVSVWDGKAVAVDRVTVGATMLPVSGIACGEPLPMFTFSIAALGFGVAAPVGVKVTLIVQVAPGASAPQPVLVCWNCEALAPVKVMPPPPIVRVVLPVFVTTTD